MINAEKINNLTEFCFLDNNSEILNNKTIMVDLTTGGEQPVINIKIIVKKLTKTILTFLSKIKNFKTKYKKE
jgi:hypothetical protein